MAYSKDVLGVVMIKNLVHGMFKECFKGCLN